MIRLSRERTTWVLVLVFAIGMAWVEAATVYYLRVLVDRVNPYQANPLPMRGDLGWVELVREAATLVMLAAVGLLAGRTRTARLGYAAVAFGAWDIFYYVFLRAIAGWPGSLVDWDVLFLLPVPWWGPVLAPVSIAALLVVGGTLASRSPAVATPAVFMRVSWRLSWLGMALALYAFMADSLRAARQGLDVTKVLPQTFNWPLFWLAVALMAAPVIGMGWRLHQSAESLSADARSTSAVGR
jgi:hypothetical protein